MSGPFIHSNPCLLYATYSANARKDLNDQITNDFHTEMTASFIKPTLSLPIRSQALRVPRSASQMSRWVGGMLDLPLQVVTTGRVCAGLFHFYGPCPGSTCLSFGSPNNNGP